MKNLNTKGTRGAKALKPLPSEELARKHRGLNCAEQRRVMIERLTANDANEREIDEPMGSVG